MKTKTKFINTLSYVVSGLLLTSSAVLANLSIETNLDNAVQTIKRVIITDDGTSAGDTLMELNPEGAGIETLKVKGKIIMGEIEGPNTNIAQGIFSSVAGGQNNQAIGNYSHIGGGITNTLNADRGVIGGGNTNIVDGNYGTVPGGYRNTAGGLTSFAAGFRAKANHDGTFVWSDRSNVLQDFASTAVNQFLIRAAGVGINTNAPAEALDVNGNVLADAYYYHAYYPEGDAGYEIGKGLWEIGTDPTEIYYNGGNVGIGTNNPAYALHVAGTVRAGDFSCSNCINAGDLAASSVGTSEITDASIASIDIADNTITETDISDSFVARNSNLLDGLDSTAFQRRVSGTCAVGSSIRVINSNGTVSCEADTDTNTNAGTICSAGYYLDGDGTCNRVVEGLRVCELEMHMDKSVSGMTRIGKRQGGAFRSDIYDPTAATSITSTASADRGNSMGIINGCYGLAPKMCHITGFGNNDALKAGYVPIANVTARVIDNGTTPKFYMMWGIPQNVWDDNTDLGSVAGTQYASHIYVQVTCLY